MNWDRVERLIGAGNLARLRAKRVAVVGLGSGGGFIALALAMSGVGGFVLLDDDTLEETNIVRHVADRRYLGWNKAEAVADLIRQRNPEAQITVIAGRLEDHLDALHGCDLVISGLDGEGAKFALNQACLDRGLTAVYAGVYERGEGGDICLIRPYDGPCYACWAGALREEIASRRETDEELDYGMIGPEGTLEAEPGLWLHVTRIASIQADMALNELLRDSEIYRAQPGNTVVVANVALEIVDGQTSFPYSSIWATIDRDPDCLVCGPHYRERDQTEAFTLQRLMENTGIVVESESELHDTATDDQSPAPIES
jgi:molybdopterin/thiamine biosynthesis adenylyltransferase